MLVILPAKQQQLEEVYWNICGACGLFYEYKIEIFFQFLYCRAKVVT
jgi:hypothetical protein